VQKLYTPCSKKGATKLIVVTSSNHNGFSNFFHQWKEKEIFNNTVYFPPHLNKVAALPLEIKKLKLQICRKSKRKCKQKMSHEPVKFPQLSENKAASKL